MDAPVSALDISTGSVVQRAVLYSTPSNGAQHLHHATAVAEVIGRAREWLSSAPEQRDENVEVEVAAFPDSGALETHDFLSASDPEPPIVIVPEIEPVVAGVISDERCPSKRGRTPHS